MDEKEKYWSRYRLGLCIQKFIEDNKSEKDPNSIVSLRKLAASSGTEYAIIQKITSGKKDPQFSTIMSIIEGFGVSLAEFATVYENIVEEEVIEYKKKLEKNKVVRENKKNPIPKKGARKKSQ